MEGPVINRFTEITFRFIGFSIFHFTCLRPVPAHFGRINARKCGNMAALTGDFVGVIIGFAILFVGGRAVTRLASDLGGQIVLDQTFSMFRSRCCIDPTGNVVERCGVAARAIKILSINTHMNIESFVGFHQ